MAALTPTPKMQFFTANGDPLVGGKLYTYMAGTSNPLPTYTDQGGLTANTNPVIMDSRGEASVWLGGGVYKFVLKDSLDTLIWTADNVANTGDLFETALAASGGSSLVGYLPAGTGAVATTVQSKLQESVSFFDFLSPAERIDVLLTTPLLDHTASMRKAITACAEGGTVYGDPKHTYSINWQTDGYCLLIEKGITIDMNGASVIYKPWQTGNAATVHSPAFFFRGTQGAAKIVNPVSGRPLSVTLSTPADSAGFATGDYVFLTSTADRHSWDYPLGIYNLFSGYGEIQQISSINAGTGVVTFSRILEGDYAATASISKLTLLNSPKLLNVKSAVEVDSGVISTAPLSENNGHFASFFACNNPVMDSWKVSSFRLFVCMSWLNVKPITTNLQGTNPPAMYPPVGGHAYVIRHHLCLGSYAAHNLGIKARHLIDYTSSHDCTQHDNIDFGSQASFVTHGFGERRIQSTDDCSYSAVATGWDYGNGSFASSYEGVITRFKASITTGYGIICQSTSDVLKIVDVNITAFGNSQAGILATSGASNVVARGGSIDMSRSTGTQSCIAAYPGTSHLIVGNITSAIATAGVNPTVTIVMSQAHGLVVGDEVHMAIREILSAENQYAGSRTVATTPDAYTFTYVVTGTTTESMNSAANGNRVWRLAGYKPVENIAITDMTLIGAPAAYSLLGISAFGTVTIDNNALSCTYPLGSAITLEPIGSAIPPKNIRINNNIVFGAHTNTVAGGEYASQSYTVSGNKSIQYTSNFIGLSGTTAQNLTRLTGSQKKFVFTDNNVASATPAGGAVFANLWDCVKAGAEVRGNLYPLNAAVTNAFNKNWEYGTFTVTLMGGTTAGTVTMINPGTTTVGRYSLSCKNLNIHMRASWSSFTGTGQMKLQGIPYSNGSTTVAVTPAESSLTFTGQLAPTWNGLEVRLKQLTGGAAGDVAAQAVGDICLNATLNLAFA